MFASNLSRKYPNSQEEQSGRNEEAQIVRKAIDALPFSKRIILELIFYQGLNQTRAGEIIGLSRSGVGQRLEAAKKLLKQSLEQLFKPSSSYLLENI